MRSPGPTVVRSAITSSSDASATLREMRRLASIPRTSGTAMSFRSMVLMSEAMSLATKAATRMGACAL